MELVDEIGCRDEPWVEAVRDGLVGDGNGDVGLSVSWLAVGMRFLPSAQRDRLARMDSSIRPRASLPRTARDSVRWQWALNRQGGPPVVGPSPADRRRRAWPSIPTPIRRLPRSRRAPSCRCAGPTTTSTCDHRNRTACNRQPPHQHSHRIERSSRGSQREQMCSCPSET